MHPSTVTLTLAAACSISSAFAAPVEGHAALPHNCDIRKPVDPVCWKQLNVGSYIQKLVTHTYPHASPDAWAPCRATESWSTCFLREAFNHVGPDCSSINSTTCAQPVAGIGKVPITSPQRFYGAYGLWELQSYISGWSKAISQLSTTLPGLIQDAAQPFGSSGGSGAGEASIEEPTEDIPVDQVLGNLFLRYPVTNDTQFGALTALVAKQQSNLTFSSPVDVPALAIQMQQILNGHLKAVSTNLTLFNELAANGAFVQPNVVTGASIVTAFCPKSCGIAHPEA